MTYNVFGGTLSLTQSINQSASLYLWVALEWRKSPRSRRRGRVESDGGRGGMTPVALVLGDVRGRHVGGPRRIAKTVNCVLDSRHSVACWFSFLVMVAECSW